MMCVCKKELKLESHSGKKDGDRESVKGRVRE